MSLHGPSCRLVRCCGKWRLGFRVLRPGEDATLNTCQAHVPGSRLPTGRGCAFSARQPITTLPPAKQSFALCPSFLLTEPGQHGRDRFWIACLRLHDFEPMNEAAHYEDTAHDSDDYRFSCTTQRLPTQPS
jgi:hypothetical protein